MDRSGYPFQLRISNAISNFRSVIIPSDWVDSISARRQQLITAAQFVMFPCHTENSLLCYYEQKANENDPKV